MSASGKNSGRKPIAKDKKKNQKKGGGLSSPYFVLFICIITTLIAYWPAIFNGWTNWDDGGYVTDNTLTRNLSFATLGNFFSTFQMGNYHPLAMISLAIDYRLFGGEATGYHLHSVVLHLLNVALVFTFIRLLTNKIITASIVAIMFGIHPAHTESVAWISERKDLLYVLYYLAALIAYLKYISTNRRPHFYFLALLFFLLSLLSKGQAVTLPVILLLIDYYVKSPFSLKVVVEKIPFFVLALTFGVIAVIAQKEGSAFVQVNYPFVERILFASNSLITYFYKALLPFPLSSFYTYPHRVNGYYSWIILASPLLAIILLSLFAYFIKRNKIIFFGFIFFLVNIFLILQLLPVGSSMMADRYTYLSYIGLFIIVGTIAERLMYGSSPGMSKFKIPLATLLVAILLLFGISTYSRNKIWKSSEALYADMLSYSSTNPIAHVKLGNMFRDKGILDSAIHHYSISIQESPDYKDALMDRAVVLSVAGRYDSAMNDFKNVLQLDSTSVMAYGDLGNLNDMKGNYDEALLDYDKALFYDSSYHEAYGNRGRAYLHKGMMDEAIKDFTLAIKYRPDVASFYAFRSDAYNAKGNYQQALNDAQIAISKGQQINPAYIQMLKEKIATSK